MARARARVRLGFEGGAGHVVQLDLDTTLARQDSHLAGDVGAREVVTGVGLGEALALGVLDDVGEAHARLARARARARVRVGVRVRVRVGVRARAG